MNNIHGARLNRDVLKPSGSGFVGSHAPDFLLANDAWSQIVHLEYGPDGSVYMIDWYDKNQCHHNDVNLHDRTNGRIFKVSYGEKTMAPFDLGKLKSESLVAMQAHPNEWYARHARRILQERGDDLEAQAMLLQLEFKNLDNPEVQLRMLLTRHAVGGLDNPDAIARKLDDPDPTIRAWTIQLATEKRPPPDSILDEVRGAGEERPLADGPTLPGLGVATAATRETDGRSSPACSVTPKTSPTPICRSWTGTPRNRWPRSTRAAPSGWHPRRGSRRIQEFMARRVGSLGTPGVAGDPGRGAGPGPLVGPSRRPSCSGSRRDCAAVGRCRCPRSGPRSSRSSSPITMRSVRSRAVALALTFGDPTARKTLCGVLADAKADLASRREALAALLKVKDASLAGPPSCAGFRRGARGCGGPRALGLRRSRRRPASCSGLIRLSDPPSVATP